jgi:hypothetical protein
MLRTKQHPATHGVLFRGDDRHLTALQKLTVLHRRATLSRRSRTLSCYLMRLNASGVVEVSERRLEDELIGKLSDLKYELRNDVRDRAAHRNSFMRDSDYSAGVAECACMIVHRVAESAR